MSNPSLGFLRFSWVVALALPFTAAGCLGDGTESLPSGPSGGVTSPAVGHQAFREYILHVQPKAKRATIHLVPISRAGASNLSPQALIDANLCSDGVSGSNDPTQCGFTAGTQTVELVTDSSSVVDTFGTSASGTCPANSFCADVTLNSFWTNPLNFTYAQITAITDASGAALSGHSASNSDSAGRTGLSNSLGLWQYQSASLTSSHFANGATGVMLSGTANGAKKTWKFANPDDADTYVRVRVMAAQTYSSYQLTSGTIPAYSDACTTVTGETTVTLNSGSLPLTQPANTNSVANFAVPFAFTFWGTRYDTTKTWTVTKWGNVGLGSVAATTSNTNVALPSTSAPHPGVFIFWDKVVWTNTTPRGLCAKLGGTAPNRQLFISWKNVGYTGGGSPMTFGLVFNESSEEIWYSYKTMVGASTDGATVGAQDDAGTTAATGGDSAANTTGHLQLASGTKLVLQPSP